MTGKKNHIWQIMKAIETKLYEIQIVACKLLTKMHENSLKQMGFFELK